MKRLGSLTLALGLALFGCGGDNVFTDADWDELHQWCLEHRTDSHKTAVPHDCGALTDLTEYLVNEEGWDKDCLVRESKRAQSAPTQPPFLDDEVDCPRDG